MYYPAFPFIYTGDGTWFFSMKPIGALNPARLKKFQERYSRFSDPIIPRFHYGSHYSSPGTVCIFRSCMLYSVFCLFVVPFVWAKMYLWSNSKISTGSSLHFNGNPSCGWLVWPLLLLLFLSVSWFQWWCVGIDLYCRYYTILPG
jgi:hypothetical protein